MTPNTEPRCQHSPGMEHFASECWVVCVHTSRIQSCRLVPSVAQAHDDAGGRYAVAGEAVCPRCLRDLEDETPRPQNYRISCGACVRSRWPLEGGHSC